MLKCKWYKIICIFVLLKIEGRIEMEENNEQMSIHKTMNPQALVSFILALVGLIILRIPCGIAAIVTGIFGLIKFDSEKQKNNKWMAIVGIIIGGLDVIIAIVTL